MNEKAKELHKSALNLMNEKKYDKSLKVLKEAIEIDPYDVEILKCLANVHFKLNFKEITLEDEEYWLIAKSSLIKPQFSNYLKSYDLNIENWTYKPSPFYPNKDLDVKEIIEINLDTIPKIRVKDELIFFTTNSQNDLKTLAEKNDIRVTRREDIWSFILEPFVETTFDDWLKEITYEKLEGYGLNKELVEEWRARVSFPIYGYNFGTKREVSDDWNFLGYNDLLQAHLFWLNEEEFSRFYWETMEVALLAYEGLTK